jgi:putative hydrolase of the HAD superfamily
LEKPLSLGVRRLHPFEKYEVSPMNIHTLLLDADGVLQHPTVRWRKALESILGLEDESQPEQFLDDILQAEKDSLVSPTGFTERLEAVLFKWARSEFAADVIEAMNAIEIHEDVMQAVQSFRRAGVRCHIASNQQALRARHMSEVLNYKSLFDREFYSCFLGVAKPSVAFFKKTLNALSCDGSTVLFLDDRTENVEAAKRAGLNAAVYLGADGAVSLQRALAGYGLSVSHRAS